jgi:hypothetical protein
MPNSRLPQTFNQECEATGLFRRQRRGRSASTPTGVVLCQSRGLVTPAGVVLNLSSCLVTQRFSDNSLDVVQPTALQASTRLLFVMTLFVFESV